MLPIDILLYFVLAMYFDQVIPGNVVNYDYCVSAVD